MSPREYLPNDRQCGVIGKPQPNHAHHCGCRSSAGRPTSDAAGLPMADDLVTPPCAAIATTRGRAATMAVPATSSDCDRSAQLAESSPGVVFAESNGTR